MGQFLENQFVHLSIKDGILYATYKKGIKINLEAAKSIVKARKEFTEYQDMKLIMYIQGVANLDAAARYYITSEEGVEHIIAAAVIVNNFFASIMSTVVRHINKPLIPIKEFPNEEKALKWLSTIKAPARHGQANS